MMTRVNQAGNARLDLRNVVNTAMAAKKTTESHQRQNCLSPWRWFGCPR